MSGATAGRYSHTQPAVSTSCVWLLSSCVLSGLALKLVQSPGRVYGKRRQGKLIFYDLKAEGAKVQVMANARCAGIKACWLLLLLSARQCLNMFFIRCLCA